MHQSVGDCLNNRARARGRSRSRGTGSNRYCTTRATGRLVFLHNVPETYEALWHGSAEHAGPTPDEERPIFGTHHHEVGYLALTAWGLPVEIAGAALHATRSRRPWTSRTFVAFSTRSAWVPRPARNSAATPRRRPLRTRALGEQKPPGCLPALEEELGVSRAVPLGLVEGQADQALEYVRMVQSPEAGVRPALRRKGRAPVLLAIPHVAARSLEVTVRCDVRRRVVRKSWVRAYNRFVRARDRNSLCRPRRGTATTN